MFFRKIIMNDIRYQERTYYSPEDLKYVMMLLWNQNIMWTRFYLISAISKLGDIEIVKNRLLENPKDISDIFRIYYGDALADELENLLRKQLMLTIDLIDSYASDNKNAQTITERIKAEYEWHNNADQLSEFLSGINPNWNKQQLQNLFHNQLDMTKDEIKKRVSKQYAADVYQYKFIEYHILMIADILTDGIIKQFYNK
jgi:hypothetical protein